MRISIILMFFSLSLFGQIQSATNTGQKTIVLDNDITLNSTTLVSLGSIVIPKDTRYYYTFYLQFQSLNNAADLRFRVNTNGNGKLYMNNLENATSKKLEYNVLSSVVPVATSSGNACDLIKLEGWIEALGIEENIEFLISNFAGTNVQVIYKDSYLVANRLR